ncbi:MAG: hypothetical protein QN198_08910 [Armatimonadota bacterium]|nr:hypothetical protein [Armatimonadota bacterium]MDR5703710.1 hypothetical protein [Armatimonadota bacterium]
MMDRAYSPCFLGNGIDAALIGYTGSMTPERVEGPERCYWYKSDCYYPAHVRVLPMPHRRISLPGYQASEEHRWYELAPLCHCWYEVYLPGIRGPRPFIRSEQHFSLQDATLLTRATYEGIAVEVQTYLHARHPLLVESYRASQPMRWRFYLAPGVWEEDDLERMPFTSLVAQAGPSPRFHYTLGDLEGTQTMVIHGSIEAWGFQGNAAWVDCVGQEAVRYVIVMDGRELRDPRTVDGLIALIEEKGAGSLYHSHAQVWEEYWAQGASVEIPDPDLQRSYAFSLYQFKASQNPHSGALPVNILRSTWSSHVFWDAMFIHLALVEAGHLTEGELACSFLERTAKAAMEAARAYGARGLKWEWEVTHEGQPAYGALHHLTHQVHNNASYSQMLWHQIKFSGDRSLVDRYYPLLRGIAEFFLTGVLQETADGRVDLRPVVGVHEHSSLVQREAATLAGSIRALRNAADAARLLRCDASFAQRCEAIAESLRPLLDELFIDGVLRAYAGTDEVNFGCLLPFFPMAIYPPDDPRVLATARAYIARNANPVHGLVGHGMGWRGPREGFPWAAGWLAAVLALVGDADTAWQVLKTTKVAMNSFGGMAEKVDDQGRWNMQYFSTAQAAFCIGVHSLLLQEHGDSLVVLRRVPSDWDRCRFDGIMLGPLKIRAEWEQDRGVTTCEVRNVGPTKIQRTVVVNNRPHTVTLRPGEEKKVM